MHYNRFSGRRSGWWTRTSVLSALSQEIPLTADSGDLQLRERGNYSNIKIQLWIKCSILIGFVLNSSPTMQKKCQRLNVIWENKMNITRSKIHLDVFGVHVWQYWPLQHWLHHQYVPSDDRTFWISCRNLFSFWWDIHHLSFFPFPFFCFCHGFFATDAKSNENKWKTHL